MVPPVPAEAVMVFWSSFRIVPVEVSVAPSGMLLLAAVTTTVKVSFGSQLVSPFTLIEIGAVRLPAGMITDDVTD